MYGLEVLYGCGAAQVEHVLAYAEVASASALARREVGKAMFSTDALAEPRAALSGSLEYSELFLQSLI